MFLTYETAEDSFLVVIEVHTSLKIISTCYYLERCYVNAGNGVLPPPPKNYKNLNMFYSCCHFILLKWKVVFTGIKVLFCLRKKSEIFCENYKFPQE